MREKRAVLKLALAILVCVSMLSAFAAADDGFIDIDGVYGEYKNDDFVFEAQSDRIVLGEIVSDIYLLSASYDDGKLVDAVYTRVGRNQSNTELTYEKLGLITEGADTVKAFLFRNMSNIEPLCMSRSAAICENDIHDAYQLLYNSGDFTTGLVGSKDGIHESMDSGWVLDNRGGIPKLSIEDVVTTVTDISTTEPVAIIKQLNYTEGEKLVAEFKCKSGGEGSLAGFYDENGLPVYEIKNINDEWCVLSKDGQYVPLFEVVMSDYQAFRVYLDQNEMKARTYIDNVYCGESELLSDNIMTFKYGVDEESISSIKPSITDVVANYGVYETFDVFGIDEVYGWKADGNVSVTENELVFSDSAAIEKPFDKINTKYVVQTQVIFPEGEDAGFEIRSGNLAYISAESKNGAFYVNGKEFYEKFAPNMWYRIRIEANPSTGRALVYVNGRNMGNVSLKGTNAVDTLRVFSHNGNARFDNILVYANPEYDDYVPEPEIKADLSDYIVAVNICNLWRDNGKHFGWACISPFDENRPVLGYYDEGNPETADWEIKYMVEHGIDVQAFCWYVDTTEGPLKNPRNGYQLHDGFKYAKYKDYMKYCLIWECSSSKYGSEQFRTHVVPFWFENYFLDTNYLILDNKIVIGAFGLGNLTKAECFGSVEGAKAEFDYLDEVAKSYSFDGIIFLGSNDMALLESLGADGRMAYHWLEAGCEFEATKNMNEATNALSDTVYQIPTISSGYNDLAWVSDEGRSPLMTVEDYDKCFDWAKNEYIPENAEKGTWQEKLVWLSTWNEYGEGTYIMPSGLNEFGYLDVLRKHFTSLSENHDDPVPTKEQAKRINRLYAQHYRYLRRQQSFEYNNPTYEYETVHTYVPTADNTRLFKVGDIVYNENGLTATATQNDFNVLFNKVMIGLDIDEVDAVKVNMQVPAGSNPTVYFTTSKLLEQDGYKSLGLVATTSEMAEYIFDFSSHPAWTGALEILRIDPAESAGVTFTLESVEFLRNTTLREKEEWKKSCPKLYVNELLVDSAVLPETKNGKILFPFDPETSIHNRIHALLTWNHDDKILTLEADGHKAEFTVGSDKYVSDGQEFDLGYTLYQADGLPMLDYEALCNALGFDYSYDEAQNRVNVITDEYGMYYKIAYPVAGEWEFDTFDTEGWISHNSNISVTDGYLTLDSTKTDNKDPSIVQKKRGVGFSIPEVDTLEFRVRYTYEGTSSNHMSLFFMTAEDTDFSENKVIHKPILSQPDSNGWVTYTIDLSDPEIWNKGTVCEGEITGFRLDPFNAIGTMDIDYIRFYKKQ